MYDIQRRGNGNNAFLNKDGYVKYNIRVYLVYDTKRRTYLHKETYIWARVLIIRT